MKITRQRQLNNNDGMRSTRRRQGRWWCALFLLSPLPSLTPTPTPSSLPTSTTQCRWRQHAMSVPLNFAHYRVSLTHIDRTTTTTTTTRQQLEGWCPSSLPTLQRCDNKVAPENNDKVDIPHPHPLHNDTTRSTSLILTHFMLHRRYLSTEYCLVWICLREVLTKRRNVLRRLQRQA